MRHSQSGLVDRVREGHEGPAGSARGLLVGVVALIPMVGLLALTIGSNTPVGPRLPLESIRSPVETAAILGPSLGAVLLGVGASNPRHRVALLFAGVFGGLAAVASPASVPAALALIGAALLLAVTHRRVNLRSAVMIVFAAGVVIGMIGSLGIEPALTRSLASLLVAIGLAGLPALTGVSRRSVGIAVVGAGLVAVVGLSAPVMVAAVSLLGMGFVGLSLPLLVVAAGGTIAAVVATVEDGRHVPALGALLAFVAGVPSSIPAGVTLIVGLRLLYGVGR